jgi:hypothetical protein
VDYLLSEDQAIYMNFSDWIFKASPEVVLQDVMNTSAAFMNTSSCLPISAFK